MILDQVVEALLENSARHFTYVEIKFFSMWWDKQTPEKQDEVKKLVEEGRLEFANGGWSMHDEACTHYDDMMNNMMIGLEWLERNLSYVPRIGWFIDTFGHSNSNPRLLADMGMDAWFFARADF